METVLCAAVGTASYQHWLEACTVYADCTVCSCRHSKTSGRVRSMYCVCVCVFVWGRSRSRTVLKNDVALPKMSDFDFPIVKVF